MRMFIAGEWRDRPKTIDVVSPFDGRVIDTVPQADVDDVDTALAGLQSGAIVMKKLPAFRRAEILHRTAALMRARSEELARTISSEEGKALAEGRLEVKRAADVISTSAEEAVRIAGDMIPLDGVEHGVGKLGFTLRVPCGIVAAITPFNFPLNLVAHKVGPALAAGNAVLLKPATDTPLSALKLTEMLLESGLPPEAIACVTGPGGALGDAICTDDRVRKISFTGSYETGDAICRLAGMKRVTMELGSNSPVIVMDDADLDKAATAIAAAGYSNAGQTCISAQRIITSGRIAGNILDALKSRVARIVIGDPLEESTQMGPMVRERDAARVSEWIDEAVAAGAQIVTGGRRDGALHQPTILDRVDPRSRVSCEELFGPVVAITRFSSVDEALALANDSRFGLSAGVFTQDIDRAMRFARELDSGNIHINWSSQWRADLMPYGGLKHSGMGKEGPKYAIREMTEEKLVVVHTG
ncbi:MAG: aldehyde dehydrogenase family protein [Planctomycetaceae bacterium]|nr:aldehyde dehydrogenase family protein [Planctomycetaceae bacterium]